MRLPGIGVLYAVPSGATPTPIPIAILKDVSLDFKVQKKPLNGQWKFAIDVAEFIQSCDLKIGQADFRASVMQMLFAQATSTTGQTLPATGEAWTIPGTPYQVTVTNSATWTEDGGVYDYTSGLWMTRVASGPATHQYSVSAGVYTFAAADTTHNVSIVYSYTSTAGNTVSVQNATMGPSTNYAVRVYNQYTINGAVKALGWKFPAVHFKGMGISLKAEDWSEANLEGIVAQDPASQTVFTAYVGD